MACMPTSSYVQYKDLDHSPMMIYSFMWEGLQYNIPWNVLIYVLLFNVCEIKLKVHVCLKMYLPGNGFWGVYYTLEENYSKNMFMGNSRWSCFNTGIRYEAYISAAPSAPWVAVECAVLIFPSSVYYLQQKLHPV